MSVKSDNVLLTFKSSKAWDPQYGFILHPSVKVEIVEVKFVQVNDGSKTFKSNNLKA